MTTEQDTEDETVVERESADGHTYTSRSVPCKVTLDAIDYKKHNSLPDTGAFLTHHIYVRCEEISEQYLPFLDANPREPSVTSQVTRMQETLHENPEDFVKKNNGLTLICDDIKFDQDDEEVTIEFSEEQGVCNGGHTYFAIQTLDAPLDRSASARIEAIQLPEELTGDERRDQIVSIAQSRNDNKGLHTSSEADYLGYYDVYRNGMSNTDTVSWHEGDADADEEAIDAVHFIRLLLAVDPLSYHHPLYNAGADRHKQLVISPGNIHSKWYDKMDEAMRGVGIIPMRHMVPLIDDILQIRDYLSYALMDSDLSGEVGGDSVAIRRTSLYQDYIGNRSHRSLREINQDTGFNLANTLETIFVGLFRSNVWRCRREDGDVGMIGWFIDPTRLWDRRQLSVLSQMSEYYQEVDSDAWQLQRQASPYEKDLYQFGWETLEGEEPPTDPEIMYEIENMATHTDVTTDYKRYVKVDTKEEATHWYSTEKGCTLHPIDNISSYDGSNMSYYEYDGK